MPVHNEKSEYNALTAKLEVAAAKYSTSTGSNAPSACASYTQAGTSAGQWRLPTIKELETIYAKKDELTGAGSFSSLYYWSATELSSDSDWAWGVNFYDGGTHPMNTKSDYIGSVLCVRDVN